MRERLFHVTVRWCCMNDVKSFLENSLDIKMCSPSRIQSTECLNKLLENSDWILAWMQDKLEKISMNFFSGAECLITRTFHKWLELEVA